MRPVANQDNEMTLVEYVKKHSERGSCRCGLCVDAPPESVQPVGHTANLVFFEVAKVGDPSVETLTGLICSHPGAFAKCDPMDGKEHSYIELGAWVGDQGLALQLMGLGAILELWNLLTPYTVFGKLLSPDLVMNMAGQGFVAVQRPQGSEL